MTNQPPYGPPGYPQQQPPSGYGYPPQQPQYQGGQQGFPPQAPQGQYPPQYGYGQPQMQQPPQMQFPQGFQPTQAPGQTQMPPPPAPGAGFYIPTEQAIRSAYDAAAAMKLRNQQARSGQFSKMKFFKILGPNGQDWKTAFVGFIGGKAIYLMPSWKDGALNFVERITHFWKSKTNPQGTSINGTGSDSLIAKAHHLAFEQGNKSAWCRPAKKFVYQGFPYECDPQTNTITGIDPSQCMHEDGSLRPLLAEFGADTHTAIQEIVNTRKFVATFHPDYGRPILIKKRKTGNNAIDVEYTAVDLDQQPLADAFRPGLGYLYALDEMFKPATEEEQVKAIMDAGLPMPQEAGGFRGQAQTGYQGQQGQMPPPGYGQAPGQYQQPPPMQPPPGYGHPPMDPQGNYGYAPPQGGSYAQFPNPPVQNPFQGQQPPPYGMQPGQPPPFMQPPPPKPLPPPPQGQMVPNAPMLPPGSMPPGYGMQAPPPPQNFGPPPGYGPPPQGQAPVTPEDLQKQLEGGTVVPF